MTSWPEKVFSFLGLGQYKASPVAAADGAAVPLLVDPYGKQRVIAEISGSASYSQYKPSTGADKKGVIKASPGSLRYIQVTSKDSSDCWFQVLNKATPPLGEGDTTLIVMTIKLPAGESRAIELPADMPFSTGIAWCASTAMGDVMLVTGEHLWVNAQYL